MGVRMIGFRADANLEIGTGHLMRCLSIAKKIKKFTDEIIFFVSDETNIEMIEKEGFCCVRIKSAYQKPDDEVHLLSDLVKKYKVKTLIVDSYFVTTKYLLTLKKYTKLIYIDDLHEMHYPCDMLVNYTIFAKRINYAVRYNEDETKLLLGCKFVPLRDEFEKTAEKVIKSNIEKILVLSGGTDNYHFVLNLIKEIVTLKKYSNVQFHVICGRYNRDKEEIKKLSEEMKNVIVYENLTELRKLMQEADLAISAGGTTLYELAACGTPTIGYTLADNQMENLKTFADEGYIESLGDIREVFPQKKLLDRINKLEDKNVRSEMSQRMKKLVDGKGCKRLAEEIMRL